MKFIESNELRDWVKDNLRKTIFQNAHALAVQTGCEVLVKLQDNMDISGRQYYATHKLQKAYINNGLRKHPAEMLVSGETGLPAVNQATQIGDEAKGTEPDMPTDNGVETEEPVVMTTSSNQTDDGEPSGEVHIKMEAMSGDEDSNDTSQDSLRDNESGMDIDMFANISPLSRNHGNSQQRFTSPLTSQSPQHLYQCAICQKTFRTINILQMHTQTFHMTHQRGAASMVSPNRMLNIQGKARSGRKSYAKQEQEQRRYPCPMCERTFHHPDLLKDHVSRSHMGQSILASSLKGIPVSSTVTTDTSSSPSPSSSSQSQGPVTSSVPGSASTQGFQDTAGPSSAAEEDLDQQIQMSPVKQLIKTETFLGNQGNHPSSLFSQSTPSPFKHPGGGMSNRNSSPATNQGVEPKGPMPISKIMKAILAIGGPVSTANTVKDNLRNRNYERVTNELFVEAANQLKDIGLGYLVACKNGSGRLVDVFIKKPPEEVVDILSTNSGLCDPTVYATTFASQTPVRLMRSSQLMENLMASGLVAEEHLKPDRQNKPEANNYNYSAMSPNDHNFGSVTIYDGSSVSMGNANDGVFRTEPIYEGNDGDGSNQSGIGNVSVYDGTEGNGSNPDIQLGNMSNPSEQLENMSNPGVQLGNSSDSVGDENILKIMKKPRFRLQPSQPSPKPTTPMSIQDIKRSILLTAGPVATYRTFAKQGSPHLRSITKEQYSQAVHELEAHDLGTVITCKRGSRPESIIYIKKPPQDVEEGLKTHDLVAMDKYTEKYQRPPPSGMNANVRLKVVELGYVTEEQMRSQPYQGRLFVPHGQADVLPV